MAYPIAEYTTPEDYLANEIVSEAKHEYFSGKVQAMAGASIPHNYIVANLIKKIGTFIEGSSCDIFPSDLRVATPFSSSFMYPDVSIVCGKNEKKENQFDTITNPAVIIEVMSPSTKANDEGYKFFYYKQIPSLKEYILIDSSTYNAQVIRKQEDDSWKFYETKNVEGVITIETLGMQLALKDIYYRVLFGQ